MSVSESLNVWVPWVTRQKRIRAAHGIKLSDQLTLLSEWTTQQGPQKWKREAEEENWGANSTRMTPPDFKA